jgi:hypothetical protein
MRKTKGCLEKLGHFKMFIKVHFSIQ